MFYQKAIATGKNSKQFRHAAVLHKDVQEHILPISEDLSKDELLQRCLQGYTLNANVSFNSTIWRLAAKHLYSGLAFVEIAPYIAAGIFNAGFTYILKLLNELEIVIS